MNNKNTRICGNLLLRKILVKKELASKFHENKCVPRKCCRNIFLIKWRKKHRSRWTNASGRQSGNRTGKKPYSMRICLWWRRHRHHEADLVNRKQSSIRSFQFDSALLFLFYYANIVVVVVDIVVVAHHRDVISSFVAVDALVKSFKRQRRCVCWHWRMSDCFVHRSTARISAATPAVTRAQTERSHLASTKFIWCD